MWYLLKTYSYTEYVTKNNFENIKLFMYNVNINGWLYSLWIVYLFIYFLSAVFWVWGFQPSVG